MSDCTDAASYAAVEVRNCYKTYDTFRWWQKTKSEKSTILNNLNLTVPTGSTYALLGPSGCGKTTLMKCILGRLQVNSGTIGIFGRQLGSHDQVTGADIGYMPQDTSIFALLTIEETLLYYGQLLGLTRSFIERQTKFLVEFLKLPPKDTINNRLSGGELRRVSFAVATIHKPKLLILDEPTVGVDPIGRQRMWCYLRYMVKTCSTTIILSTHYIEEARSVDYVGLLQDGSLLVEGTPDFLLEKWNVLTLEELFFKVFSSQLESKSKTICTNDRSNDFISECNVKPIGSATNKCNDDYESEELTQNLNKMLFENQIPKESDSRSSGSLMLFQVAAIVKKNSISLYRHPITLLFLFSLPAVNIFISFMAMSSTISNLDVGVFNEDQGHLGNVFLNSLNDEVITQIQCNSYEDCHKSVVEGDYYGFIGIQKNFSHAFRKRFIDLNTMNQDVFYNHLINVTVDKTNLIILQTLVAQFTIAMENLGVNALHEAGLSPNLSNSFLQVSYQPKALLKATPGFPIVPPGIMLSSFDIQVGTSVLLLFLEKKSSYLERSLVSGVTFFEIVIGYVIIDFFLNLVQVGGSLLVIFGILKMPLLGSLVLTTVMNVLSGLVGMSYGMFLAAISDQLMVLAPMGFAVMISAPGLAALFWPMEAANYAFQIICKCLPFYLPTEALIDIMYRNLGIFHADVIIGISIMIAWIVILTSMSIFSLHLKAR